MWAPSLVRRVLRHRGLHAVGIVALGCVTSFVVADKIAAVEAERASWGETQVVVVALGSVDRGEPVRGLVALREFPVALLPANAATSVDPDSLAKVGLHPGEIVLSDRLTTATGNTTPTGSVAVTLPVARQVPLVEVGAIVDLWSVDSANFSSRRIAFGVSVLAFSDDDITIAVPHAQVGEVTAASLRPVTVTLVG